MVLPRGVAFGHAKVEVYDKKEVFQREILVVFIFMKKIGSMLSKMERDLCW